ncbi:aminopeptidase N [Pseudahrensia aquimaris]|uniref:Aminopeptidase N n=1 Tax=Pseudahrensia aquimaris TaxID=744461 RepID=A0ABW3FEG8_9HYPH
MRTTTAPVIRLKNYTPPAYTITHVDMDVSLAAEDTVVTTTMKVVRQAGTPTSAPLVLDGDELSLDGLWINGDKADDANYSTTPVELKIHRLPETAAFDVTIRTRLAPVKNTKLMGLYQSSGVFCTQCEAEGFRRITYFLDRPDVLAVYKVRLEADKATCPILLANGNPGEAGELPDGRHFAVWHDPHPKPSYLFAMVGGDLDVLSDTFTTASGRHVDLNIYVETGKAAQAAYAMDALKRSMVWDELEYGCEYDLEVFNIVAVSDFNMGAMENKGLNVFNDKYVLADADLATDADFANIEAIIAHEYFHNWTGNRITCRDWFQLCLKEGLTVYRDQEFSADQRSRAVQRIQQVRWLKSGQFPEDAGPLAHPVRPSAYKEINNFYTATVYQKGAELVRMIATLIGPEAYRAGTDLYFERHDGEAAVVEDFLKCFEDAAGVDLSQFARWYEQAGTPNVDVEEEWDAGSCKYTLVLRQHTPPTPGQQSKKLVPIPVRFGLMGSDGSDIEPRTRSSAVKDDVIVLTRRETKVTFTGLKTKPTPSLLRGFSAPVKLNFAETQASRLFRAEHDSDLFNRWEALDGYGLSLLSDDATGGSSFTEKDREAFVLALCKTALDDSIEPQFRANALSLPNEMAVARNIGKNVDPAIVQQSRSALLKSIGRQLGKRGLDLMTKLDTDPNADDLAASGERALKYSLLPFLLVSGVEGAHNLAQSQFVQAKTMTDRMGALSAIVHFSGDEVMSEQCLEAFYDRYEDNDLVLNTWFTLQAMVPNAAGLERFERLLDHPKFSLNNPNRARSLLGPFAANNPTAFYANGAKGATLFAQQIMTLDDKNPQIAARLLTVISSYRVFKAPISDAVTEALRTIRAKEPLSIDVQEIVDSLLS